MKEKGKEQEWESNPSIANDGQPHPRHVNSGTSTSKSTLSRCPRLHLVAGDESVPHRSTFRPLLSDCDFSFQTVASFQGSEGEQGRAYPLSSLFRGQGTQDKFLTLKVTVRVA